MHRLIKLLVITVIAAWVLAACQSAEPEMVESVAPTAVVTNIPATDIPPPTDLPPATDTPEPTVEIVEAVEAEAVADEQAAEEIIEEIADEVIVEVVEEVPAEQIVEVEPEQEAREAIIINGYTNVVYTQNDAELLGSTGKPQLLNVYAEW